MTDLCFSTKLQLHTEIERAIVMMLETSSKTGWVPYRNGCYVLDVSLWNLGTIIVRFTECENVQWERKVQYSNADTVALIIQRAGKPKTKR